MKNNHRECCSAECLHLQLQIRLEGVGPLRSGQDMIADRHRTLTHTPEHTHTHTFGKCGIESVVYPVSLRTAQEKLHETPCLLQRSARLLPDLTWIHLSKSWPDLTWMSHSLVSGPRGLVFFSLRFLFSACSCSLLLSHPDACMGREVCVRACSSVYTQRCVVAHMRKASGRLFVFSNILHCVWRVVLKQQEQELNNFPNGYLWPSENMSYHCLSHSRGKACHCSSTVFTTLQCHTHKKKKAVVENLDLMQISFHHITKQTR